MPLPITIIGAGPVGCLLAIILRKQGHPVQIYELRPDLRQHQIGGGRSINFVLTSRGLLALDLVGLKESVLKLTTPVLGRMMHDVEGTLNYQPYGVDDSECNYAVSREELNKTLLTAAEEVGAQIFFEQALREISFEKKLLYFHSQPEPIPFDTLFGCDGSPSTVRQELGRQGHIEESRQMMKWAYKELTFPRQPENAPSLERKALHIWPRGHHFLMALANLDGSFTGTIYLPLNGQDSFQAIDSPAKTRAFFEYFYPDAIQHLGDFVDEFLNNPLGNLGTVQANPWHFKDQCLLVGDAAHGIVPFFGQGLNAGFEDCTFLHEALSKNTSLQEVFAAYSQERKPNGDAIAAMSLENFVEMSDKVGDPHFRLQKEVESLLEKNFPSLYRSRYAQVMYTHIPYAQAFENGERQKELLEELTKDLTRAEDLDLERAKKLLTNQGFWAAKIAKSFGPPR